MKNVLVNFHHLDCLDERCQTNDAVDFEVAPKGFDGNNGFTVIDSIKTAVKRHVKRVHKGERPTHVYAYFEWEGKGYGSNIMEIDKEMAWTQIMLAQDRGCGDWITIEFSTKAAQQGYVATGKSSKGEEGDLVQSSGHCDEATRSGKEGTGGEGV